MRLLSSTVEMTRSALAVARGSRAARALLRSLGVWVFVLPALVVYAVFFLAPFVQAAYLSLTDWNGVRPTLVFVGLDNYARMTGDPLFWRALGNTVIWVVVGTLAPIIISLGLAMLIWRRTHGQGLFQAIFFLPQIISTVAIGLIWSQLYHPLTGLLNELLRGVGLGNLAQGWLGSSDWAFWAVLVAAVWSYFGFALVVIMAGLRNVNLELLDAASIDGAGAWARFTNVIIPQLRHVLTMITAYTLVGGFNVFDVVWVMTGGGPANASEVLATHLYKRAFVEDDVAYGTTLAMMLSAISLVVSVVFIYLRERGDASEIARR